MKDSGKGKARGDCALRGADYHGPMTTLIPFDGMTPDLKSGRALVIHAGETWYDAILYCNERSKFMNLDTIYKYDAIIGIPGDGCILKNVQTHYNTVDFRLPTEAEWEYAASG